MRPGPGIGPEDQIEYPQRESPMPSRIAAVLLEGCVVSILLTSACSADESPPNAKFGRKIEPLAVKDATGKEVSVPDVKGRKAAVVVFLSFDCPVSNSYAAQLAELAKTYGEAKVSFVALCND